MKLSEINSAIKYDPETGDFFWRKDSKRRKAGEKAGWVDKAKSGNKYLKITINGKKYSAHRLAWMIMNGNADLCGIIDHKDGNGLNNKWNNLRLSTHALNNKNCRYANGSGIKGIYERVTYLVYIGENQYVGSYNDFFEACCARKSMENKLMYDVNHGKKRPR